MAAISSGIEPQLQTPRQAKLYGNALAFALPLLKGEAHPVDLMLVEGVRVFYPKLYAVIRDNPDLFLKAADETLRRDQHRQRISKLIDDSLEDGGLVDKDRVRSRLVEVLFPRSGNAGYGHDWDLIWSKEQRIRSSEYFQRFFTYSVPPGDVGDREVERILEDLGAAQTTSEVIDAQLKAIAERRGIPSGAILPVVQIVCKDLYESVRTSEKPWKIDDTLYDKSSLALSVRRHVSRSLRMSFGNLKLSESALKVEERR